jgi:Xylose isomerase-like TIM barrel
VTRFPIGVIDIVYAGHPVGEQVKMARTDGYAHLDAVLGVTEADTGGFPLGCPTAFPKPVAGWCACPAPPAGDGSWERAVRWWRAAPGALMEPWAGAVVNSVESMRAVQAEIPGLRFLVDTGHVADWGGDVFEILTFADHVQLRQGAPGRTQLHVDDPDGVHDFPAIVSHLDSIGYTGVLTIEYFDLPEHGWPLADPRTCARDLLHHLR